MDCGFIIYAQKDSKKEGFLGDYSSKMYQLYSLLRDYGPVMAQARMKGNETQQKATVQSNTGPHSNHCHRFKLKLERVSPPIEVVSMLVTWRNFFVKIYKK